MDGLERNDLPLAVRASQWLDVSGNPVSDGILVLLSEVRKLAGPPREAAEAAGRVSAVVEGDLEFFQVVDQVGEIAGYQSYVKTYPDGVYADAARDRIRELSHWSTPFKRFPIIN